MNWVLHGGSTTIETKSSYCRVAQQEKIEKIYIFNDLFLLNKKWSRIRRVQHFATSKNFSCSEG